MRYQALRAILVGVMVSSVALFTSDAECQQQSKPTYSLAISVQPETVSVGGEVKLEIDTTNLIDQPILLLEAGNLYPGNVILKDSGGRIADLNPIYANSSGQLLSGSRFSSYIKPGKTRKEYFRLRRFYELNVPGKYSVQVGTFDPYDKKLIFSNVVTLTITK